MKISILFVLSALLLTSCMSDSQLKEKMKKAIKEDPSIITIAMEEKPVEFMEAFQKALEKARAGMAKKKAEEERKRIEDTYNNPFKPAVEGRVFFGKDDAPLTLVEYSDFECPYCEMGFQRVQELMKKYDGKIKFVYKHFPLNFHKCAMPSASFYEAIALQDKSKAAKFHDKVFAQFRKLSSLCRGDLDSGLKFLKKVAKSVGANVSKMEKDSKSDVIRKKIMGDMEEAQKFGINGTPGFILNGVPVPGGAAPIERFEEVISELKKRGKLNI